LLKHKDGSGKFSVKYLQQGLVPMGYLKSVFISEISEKTCSIFSCQAIELLKQTQQRFKISPEYINNFMTNFRTIKNSKQ